MTLYYSLVFMLLVFEMVIFVSLIVPMPLSVRRKLFTFLSESPIIAKIQYGMKITFIFILVLFIDSVNRVYRVQQEVHSANKAQGSSEAFGGTARMEVQARKFYSQRNMYLCGFTLFLSLILNRTYVMILDVLRLEEENKALKGEKGAKGDTAAKLGNAGEPGEIAKIRKENEALKRQMEGLSREYNRLGDEKGGATDGTPKKDR